MGVFELACVLGPILLVVVIILLLKLRPQAEPQHVDTRIDVQTLGTSGPAASGPQLEIRHVPVRLALLILAPVGRGKQLPPGDLSSLADSIVPGLSDCVRAHGTRVIRWPPQLSSQGFVQAFYGNVPLPGNRGRGTIWSGAAGKCDSEAGSFLAGMIVAAARPNSLGSLTVASAHEWFDLLRVKEAA